MKKVTYPTNDGGVIHEYTKKRDAAVSADTSSDETTITVKLASNVDFVRIESICISRKERD